MQSQRQGNIQTRKDHFLFLPPSSKHFCLTLLFLPSYSPFSCQASSSAVFSYGSSLLHGHFHLPIYLPLIPSGRRRGEEEHEGTCADFQTTAQGCLPAHERCSLRSSAKSNVMPWGITSQVRRRVLTVFQSLFRTLVLLANASTHHGHIPQASLPLMISPCEVGD